MWEVYSLRLVTTRHSHQIRAHKLLNHGMWRVISPGLATTRQSHPVWARKLLNNGMWRVYSLGLITTRRSEGRHVPSGDDDDLDDDWLIYFELFLPGCPGSQHCQPSQVAGQVWFPEIAEVVEEVGENELVDKEVKASEDELLFNFWIFEQQLSAALQQSASRETSAGS